MYGCNIEAPLPQPSIISQLTVRVAVTKADVAGHTLCTSRPPRLLPAWLCDQSAILFPLDRLINLALKELAFGGQAVKWLTRATRTSPERLVDV